MNIREPFLDLLRFDEDFAFDDLYPRHIKALSRVHWTPLNIAQMAAEYLSEPNARVLDIGSGVGKFCITAGYHNPETHFFGIEQRQDLFLHAKHARDKISLPNVEFIHGNLTELSFDDYDHFYFFNSFYENLKPEKGIDKKVKTTAALYNYYTQFVFHELNQKPSGTRLVTYHGAKKQIPPSYQLIDNNQHWALKMWMKE